MKFTEEELERCRLHNQIRELENDAEGHDSHVADLERQVESLAAEIAAVRNRTAKHIRRLRQEVAEQGSWITHLESRIAAKDEVFAEIRREVGGNCFDPTPLEEPDLDGPWLPCGLMSKIDDVMERGYRT